MSDQQDASGWPDVPGYDLLEVIGRGGFSTVYRGTQTSVDALRAVKVLSASLRDEAAERRFHREVHAVGALSDHPNVVGLIDAGTTTDGRPFIVMQIVDGGSFGAEVRRSGPLEPGRVRRVGREVGDALEAAHEAGILHRDIKPDNVLIGRRGRAMLTDFGIATLTDSSDSTSGRITGTLAYTAPEIVEGERPGVASDVFSLGTTLYALAAGRGPFDEEADHLAAIMWRITNEEPPPLPPHVPADLVELIGACMAKAPERRPPLTEVVNRLREGGTGADVEIDTDRTIRLTAPPSPAPRSPAPARQSPAPAPQSPAPAPQSPAPAPGTPTPVGAGIRSTLGRAPSRRRSGPGPASSAPPGRPALRGTLGVPPAAPGAGPPAGPVSAPSPRGRADAAPGRPSAVVVASVAVALIVVVVLLSLVLIP